MFSRFFIERPIFATVISIVVVLAGLLSIENLPVAQYPEITPPTVTISAQYPGASADTIQKTVAAPIEQQVNGVEHMIYMSSTSSSSGTVNITVSFEIGTDPDQATINVNNRVQQALPTLPEEVRRLGVTVEKRSTNFLQIVALQSPDGRYDTIYLNNYAILNIIDELKRVPGVGNATVFGAQDYSMRIWLKPDRMQQLKLTATDIVNAINEQNSQFAAGKVGAPPTPDSTQLTYTVTTQGRLTDARQFENIILRANPDGSVLRLKDVARVELGALSYDVASKLNGKPSVAIGIYLQSGANALAVADGVRAAMQHVAASFPSGISYSIPYDTTRFVVVSIKEVIKTLFEAMVLVFLVVYLFLQNWRATIIPCIAVPVSLIGAFAGMYLLGFSINTLTLLGLVLAIGIVVDDAIVVLENVERIMAEEKLPPKQAAIKAMTEVSGPVVAIVLVLCSVFIPVAFLGGMTGLLYKQFAITLAVSVAISGFVALTLSPALCALLLKPTHHEPRGFFRWFNRGFEWLTHRYTAGVALVMRRGVLALLIFAALIAATWGLFRIVPTSFIPPEDQGFMIAAVILPDAASLHRTEQVTDRITALQIKNSSIADTLAINGFDLLSGGSRTSSATMFMILKPWDERKSAAASVNGLIGRLMAAAASIRQALVLAFNPPAIPGLGATGGFEFYIQNRGTGDSHALAAVTQKFIAAAAKRPELTGVSTQFRADVPQLYIDVDRDQAQAYGVKLSDIFNALQSTFGALYVNDFNKFGRTYRVQLQAEAPFRSTPADISKVWVRSSTTGDMVPLATLVDVKRVTGPETVDRFNLFPAANVIGNAAPGYSSGQAIAAMEQVAKQVLPSDYSYAWSGISYEEKKAGSTSTMAFAFGIIMVFLVLAAQYEKWSLPISVILAVPFGLFGAMLAVWLRGLSNDIYFQISLLTLIGLAAKNAILIVEFAVLKHDEGMPVGDAALEAARLRFRPILMTSMAFILGVVPLAIATGAGAASRHSIGTGVVGGMLSATFLAVFFVPLFYVLVSRRKRGVAHDDAGTGATAGEPR
jgi:hydrophobe/amphiphile efflux-1 (HAE1) family protein